MLLALWISDVRASALIAVGSSHIFFFFWVKSGVRGAKPSGWQGSQGLLWAHELLPISSDTGQQV